MASAEFALIHRYFDRPQPGVTLAVGDDCALVQPAPGQHLAVSTDTLVSGVHFFPDVPPAALGHKALAVNLSDLAAMGAVPRWFTLALTLPGLDENWIAGFAEGLHALADTHHIRLIGGDTTRGPLSLTLTVLGEVSEDAALRRDRAQAGDEIWVSGHLGDAGLALQLLLAHGTRYALDPGLRRRLEQPVPRLALGAALRGVAHAAIDISDGLLADLGHICTRSALGATLQASVIPLSDTLRAHDGPGINWQRVLAGGDDYELCFTASPAQRKHVLEAGRAAGVAVTCIGNMRERNTSAVSADPDILVLDSAGVPLPFDRRGYDHFQAP